MYTKAEASNIKREFWTTLGMYMKPVKNAEGNIINWVNYKTGIRHIYFRMDADNKAAAIAIELKHPAEKERLLVYEQLGSLKNHFNTRTGEDWEWQPVFYDDDGTRASRIFTVLEKVSVFNKENWPSIISFLKERMIKLDAFWNDVKFQFEM
ncbi:DUF4268 domain-containing protein [Niabella aquatica]